MDTFPAGNAKISDTVWYREASNRPYDRTYKVVEVGLINEAGYPLDIRIDNGTRTHKLGPWGDNVLVLPPPEEWQAYPAVVRFLSNYSGLLVVRDPCNAEDPRYTFICPTCQQPLFFCVKSTERSDFGFRASAADPAYVPGAEATNGASSGFCESKPSLIDGSTVLMCGCHDYEPPYYDAYI